jgi:hypothetical protein
MIKPETGGGKRKSGTGVRPEDQINRRQARRYGRSLVTTDHAVIRQQAKWRGAALNHPAAAGQRAAQEFLPNLENPDE